jgi:hypothetical protein
VLSASVCHQVTFQAVVSCSVVSLTGLVLTIRRPRTNRSTVAGTRQAQEQAQEQAEDPAHLSKGYLRSRYDATGAPCLLLFISKPRCRRYTVPSHSYSSVRLETLSQAGIDYHNLAQKRWRLRASLHEVPRLQTCRWFSQAFTGIVLSRDPPKSALPLPIARLYRREAPNGLHWQLKGPSRSSDLWVLLTSSSACCVSGLHEPLLLFDRPHCPCHPSSLP